MTAEELRKAKWLVADASAALLVALKDWPEESRVCYGMLSAAAFVIENVVVVLDKLEEPDADT